MNKYNALNLKISSENQFQHRKTNNFNAWKDKS